MTDVAAATAVRPFDAERALIAVVNDSVFVEEIYSGERERAGYRACLMLWGGRAALIGCRFGCWN